jgi:hypothetical protein
MQQRGHYAFLWEKRGDINTASVLQRGSTLDMNQLKSCGIGDAQARIGQVTSHEASKRTKDTDNFLVTVV